MLYYSILQWHSHGDGQERDVPLGSDGSDFYLMRNKLLEYGGKSSTFVEK